MATRNHRCFLIHFCFCCLRVLSKLILAGKVERSSFRIESIQRTISDLCFAVPPRQFGKEIFQDKSLIHRVIKSNRTVSSSVYVVHFHVEFRRRPPIVPPAFRVHHDADCRRITQRAVFDRTVSMVFAIPFNKLFNQVLTQRALVVDSLHEFSITDRHSLVDGAGYLPQLNLRAKHYVGRGYIVP